MAKVYKGYKYRIKPSEQDKLMFAQTFGCARKVWNILVDEYKKGVRPISEIKNEFEYMKLIDSQALTSTWYHFNQTMKNVKKGVCGLPNFKSKYNSIQSYTTYRDCSNLRIKNERIYLRKVGWVRVKMHRVLPKDGIVKAATISREAGKYYISLRIEYENKEKEKEAKKDYERIIGLDYSPSKLYVDQKGNSPIGFLKFMDDIKKEEEKVKEISRILSAKIQGSNNWKKIKNKLQKQQKHIRNKRKDYYHKESRRIVDIYDVVSIESLDLRSMGKKPKYNPDENIGFTEATKAKRGRKAVYRTGYRIFTEMLSYKLEDERKRLIKINRHYPSSKTCAICKRVQAMPTDKRVFECEVCGHAMDRDQNAALNIVNEGLLKEFREETRMNGYKWISA